MAPVMVAVTSRPRTSKRGLTLASVVGALAMVAAITGLQRCFSAPQVAAPVRTLGAAASSLAKVECEFDGELVAAGETFAGAAVTPLWQHAREPAVVMYNKKSGRKDRSEGWTNRKKFRLCSTLARMATKKGRKIAMRRLKRGKRVDVNPGDYVNPKMERTMKIKNLR
eukprot:TRINITY_DN4047_c0_g2_i1.p1 TRINITY_DN4047_c0_g2~~TRINITY_DN4047_c0_g2_i1.p1  ORF type:complete len:168 (+),score=47.62 TRINITY_DN4047_c0_g2_i1:93-596(+)